MDMGRFGAETVKPTVLVGTVPFLGSLGLKARRPLGFNVGAFSALFLTQEFGVESWTESGNQCVGVPRVFALVLCQVTGHRRKVLQWHAKGQEVARVYHDRRGRRRVCGGRGLKATQRYPFGPALTLFCAGGLAASSRR